MPVTYLQMKYVKRSGIILSRRVNRVAGFKIAATACLC